MKGIIQEDSTILGSNGKTYTFEFRSNDEVLMDATAVGGRGFFARQSYKPYIGMTVEFDVAVTGKGYNYTILKDE